MVARDVLGMHRLRWDRVIPTLMTAVIVALVVHANWRDARRRHDAAPIPIGLPGGAITSREELKKTIDRMEHRLAEEPLDSAAGVALADALMRQARVTQNAGLAVRGEEALLRITQANPRDYEAQRMLGAVYLSEHRFREAIRTAQAAHSLRPRDAWNLGVMGDGHIELGDYPEAFDSFEKMLKLRPSAAAYARMAYALELQGELDRALAMMKMSAEATSPHDPESQAWHYAQVGDLYCQIGKIAEAEREFERANFTFSDHPFAAAGLVRVAIAKGDLDHALRLSESQFARSPSPEWAAQIGDLYSSLGQKVTAERYYLLAETAWRVDSPQPVLLARFLVERNRRLDEAIPLAEQAARDRQDILTDDTLPWAYFKAGRVNEALKASAQALRTGTRDRTLLYHAAAIAFAAGHPSDAARLVEWALDGHPRFDLISAPAAAQLKRTLEGRDRIAAR